MPVLSVKMGKTEKETKKKLIEKLTATAAEVTAIPQEAFIVFIEELDGENIGIGGTPLAER